KMVFGLPVNQYYQKHRMNKAKAMLLSKKYSPGQTATALGFSGVSNFNKAFFKAYEQLPAEIAVPFK
ncbi:MAG TPA: helix-turn-helix domain-containing protein, partial [Panacibacter sp.]|nr:helix-turn-helix domain-containing protein [Panacibacter sp.]